MPQEKLMTKHPKYCVILKKDYMKPEDLIIENGLLKQLTKKLLERAMQAEMTEHLSYVKTLQAAKTAVIHVTAPTKLT